jgi:hypothetical protein
MDCLAQVVGETARGGMDGRWGLWREQLEIIRCGLREGEKLHDLFVWNVARVDVAHELIRLIEDVLPVDGPATAVEPSIFLSSSLQWGDMMISYWVE